MRSRGELLLRDAGSLDYARAFEFFERAAKMSRISRLNYVHGSALPTVRLSTRTAGRQRLNCLLGANKFADDPHFSGVDLRKDRQARAEGCVWRKFAEVNLQS